MTVQDIGFGTASAQPLPSPKGPVTAARQRRSWTIYAALCALGGFVSLSDRRLRIGAPSRKPVLQAAE